MALLRCSSGRTTQVKVAKIDTEPCRCNPQAEMFSKERLLDLASSLASSATQIAVKSLGQREVFCPHDDYSGQDRLHLKRVIERFLCVGEEDTSSDPPALIGEPAADDGAKDFFFFFSVSWVKSCRSWLKRKYISSKATGKGSFSTFEQVMKNMDLSTLPAYASSLRRSKAAAGLDETANFECTVKYSPMLGSFHALFPVVFKDGVRWLFKIPAAGHIGRWDSSAARALRSEALTMQMLQRQTSIPIPKVYSFDASLDNNFKCPFILMEYIDGEPLYKSKHRVAYFSVFPSIHKHWQLTVATEWYNGFTSVEAQEKFREQALQGLAAATVQLSAFKYSQAGSPSFDENGKLQEIEPVRVVDIPTTYSRLIAGCADADTVFCELGPYSNATDYFRSMLDKHQQKEDPFSQGESQVLRLFLDWIPKEVPFENETFVIAHPDFNLQNVLVAEDGTLQGLIDWDGVSTVPCSVGCLFPKWLTLDWDPANYTYGIDLGCKYQFRHHSPAKMKHYRTLYARFIEESATKYNAQAGNIPLELANITRKSIVIDSINQAVKNPYLTCSNVFNILDKIAHITSQTYFKAYCDAYESNIERAHSIIPGEQNLQIEGATEAEESSSSNGSSDFDDSVFSETSAMTGDSSEHSEPSSKPEEQQSAMLQHSDPHPSDSNDSEGQRIVNQDFREKFDKPCLISTQKTKSWRQVPSLVQSASRQVRASVKRLKVTKSQQVQFSGVSSSVDSVQTKASKTTSTTSAGSLSKTVMINHPKPSSKTLAPMTYDEASYENDYIIWATASDRLDLEMAVNEETKQNHTKENHKDGQRCSSDHADLDQYHTPVLSTEQQNALSDSVYIQSEQGDGSLLSNSLSATPERRKETLGRRLKAKLAINHNKKGNRVRESSPSLSVGSGDSRRKRILAWIRKTSQKPPSDEQNSESSGNSDSILPNIPRVSIFDIPSLDEAGFNTNDDINDIKGTQGEDSINMTNMVTACATKLPSYDAGTPVDKDKLRREGFATIDICYGLAEGTFDEARMRRLRLGFAALLDWL